MSRVAIILLLLLALVGMIGSLTTWVTRPLTEKVSVLEREVVDLKQQVSENTRAICSLLPCGGGGGVHQP